MTGAPITIEDLRQCPELLDAVVALGKRLSSKLGFMPLGGFQEHMNGGTLLVARRDEELLGYLLYRTPQWKRHATIVHLCVAPDHQGSGVGRLLIEAVKSSTRELDGIRLQCRRDYPENAFWPRVGFQLLAEIAGKGSGGTELNVWWLPHRELPLLAMAYAAEVADRVLVAIDANVFFDFWNDSPDSEESRALLADWLAERVCLRVTAELSVEFDRNGDAEQRRLNRDHAAGFGVVAAPSDMFSTNVAVVRGVLGVATSASDESDQRALAHAAGSEAVYFVTRDTAILNACDALEAELSIRIVRPADLILEIDGIAHESNYQPRRFEGSRLRVSTVSVRSEDDLCAAFLDTSRGERKHNFLRRLRSVLARSQQCRSILVSDQDSQPVALVALDGGGEPNTEVVLLRAASHRLAPTVVRQLLTSVISQRRAGSLLVSDTPVTESVETALRECRFTEGADGWSRILAYGIGASEKITDQLMFVSDSPSQSALADRLREAVKSDDARVLAERYLWPAKFTDVDLPTFIVPIRPSWAMQLFDINLASNDLFGLPPELGFRLENAYYRRAKPEVVSAPARLLWYVSGDVGAIRACSYLDEVIIDGPKALFARFRRLGVYRWEDVFDAARNDLQGQVMALKFSETELLPNPVPFARIQEILAAYTGKGNPFMSPVRVPANAFFELYREALYGQDGATR